MAVLHSQRSFPFGSCAAALFPAAAMQAAGKTDARFVFTKSFKYSQTKVLLPLLYLIFQKKAIANCNFPADFVTSFNMDTTFFIVSYKLLLFPRDFLWGDPGMRFRSPGGIVCLSLS
jgi:hypothetical protein